MEWQPIETAPKDGQKIILAKYDYVLVGDLREEWVTSYQFCWACSGFWSERWNNWNDGVEPCGLHEPTHWTPIPTHPARP